jgi:hypothetical protein
VGDASLPSSVSGGVELGVEGGAIRGGDSHHRR